METKEKDVITDFVQQNPIGQTLYWGSLIIAILALLPFIMEQIAKSIFAYKGIRTALAA